MKPVDASECEVQIFVCTNDRPNDKSCCKKFGGQEFYQRLKDKLKAEGLNNIHWATRTGCLGYCNDLGTTVEIRRRGQEPVWFTEVTAEDFDKVWELSTKR